MAEGGASSVLAVADYGNVPLAREQKYLTPLQRMVIQLEVERQQEEAQQGQQGAPSQGSRPTGGQGSMGTNTHPAAGGQSISGETVTYVNEGATNDG